MIANTDMIDTAIIPIAGRAKRHEPLSRVVPKALLPLPHPDGLAVPVVHWTCAEAAAAGIEQALLVVSPDQQAVVEQYFAAAVSETHPLPLPPRIRTIVQPRPAGLGAAVSQAASELGEGRFLVMLGDHIYAHRRGIGACASQVIEAAGRYPAAVAMIGVQAVDAAELPRVGVLAGEPAGGRVYRCTDFVEKPDAETARLRLTTPDLEPGQFLAHCGLYMFGPQILDCLTEVASMRGSSEEVELAAAQSMLLDRHRGQYLACRIDGRAWDTGTPRGYIDTFTAFACPGAKES